MDGEGSSRAEPAEKGDKDADKALTAYKIIDYAGKKFAWAEMQPLPPLRAHVTTAAPKPAFDDDDDDEDDEEA